MVLVAEGDFATHESQHAAVAELLAEHLGHTVEIAHTEAGAPYIQGFNGYISISHCAVAVAVAISRHPVGVDIEGHRYEKMRRIAHRYVSAETIDMDIDSPTMLSATWCAKEAIYKLHHGEGFSSHVSVGFPFPKHILTIKHTKNYTLAVAMERSSRLL